MRIAAIASLAFWPLQVRASPIEFTFNGIVNSINDPLGNRPPPWNGVNVGDPWTLTYRFESTTPDSDPSPTLGEYAAIDSYSLTIGSAIDTRLILPTSTFIRVFDGEPAGLDQYMAAVINEIELTSWFMQLVTANESEFPTDALPLCGDIDVANFEYAHEFVLYSFGGSPEWDIRGPIQTHSCGPCETDADCNDGDVCTFDECSNGSCLHGVIDPCCQPSGPCPCSSENECAFGFCCNVTTGFCEPPPCRGIPTVSEWGLVVLTLMLLIGAKIYFARRETATILLLSCVANRRNRLLL